MIDLTGVRAMTLRPPWSHLITHHGKRIENRSWAPWDWMTQVVIHAGKNWQQPPDPLSSYGCRCPRQEIVTAAFVAVADIAHVCGASRWHPTLRCHCPPQWAQPGQYHWQLQPDIRVLTEPVPAVGRQGVWLPARDIVERIESLMPERTR